MAKPRTETVHGQLSYQVASDRIEAWLTRTSGMLGPVSFTVGDRIIKPFSVAPWAENNEAIDPGLPPLLHTLRGDFFCLPFGGNENAYRGEQHPPHGDTANLNWTSASVSSKDGIHELKARMNMKSRDGKVEKVVRLVDGHEAVYQTHTVTGMGGAMSPGHHAMLKLPEYEGSGKISSSRFKYAQVLPFPFEDATIGGYHALKPDAKFSKLDSVPLHRGGKTDVSVYPARLGYDDLVMMISDDKLPFAWTAVTCPQERAVYFALKNPRVLRNTILWLSNAGRHYHPWNGRHKAVLGIEDVTAYYHIGLAESAKKNPLSAKGYPTHVTLKKNQPFVVNYIFGMTDVPKGFDEVKSIQSLGPEAIELTSKNGKKATATVNVSHLD